MMPAFQLIKETGRTDFGVNVESCAAFALAFLSIDGIRRNNLSEGDTLLTFREKITHIFPHSRQSY